MGFFVYRIITFSFKDINKRYSMRYDWTKKKGKQRQGDLEIVMEASRPLLLLPSKVTTSKPHPFASSSNFTYKTTITKLHTNK
jgi:hypothetical protein